MLFRSLNQNPHIKLLVILLGANDPWNFPNPARFRENLSEFFLCHRTHLALLIKENTTITCCPCIECHYILCHKTSLLFLLNIISVCLTNPYFIIPYQDRQYNSNCSFYLSICDFNRLCMYIYQSFL